MKKKILVCLLMVAAISTTIFMIGANATQYPSLKASDLNLKTSTIEHTMADHLVSKYGYSPIEINKKKKGDMESNEEGLYWDRDSVQMVLYPDVQEICEQAFGDYLSPLQGLTGIMTKGVSVRYRTDKQTASISPGFVRFYLFIGDKIAVVTIKDRGDSYDTTFRILRDEETKGIKVLEVPPPAGIGIAGTEHKPAVLNYATHSTVTKDDESNYSKADIQLVFAAGLQGLTQKIFGNYVQALQGLYMLAEQEGYGSIARYSIEDAPMYDETTVIKDNYFEFTLIVNAKDRIRVAITKDGDQYVTTFRLLKDGEFEIPELGG